MSMRIDPEQPLPIYVQLKNLLLEEILAGKYDGRRVPTEHELSAEYSISRTPVHRALAELAEEGVILRQRRHGSFVNPHWLQRNRGLQELRVVVPEGPWEQFVRAACPEDISLNVATVELADLHQVLTHAVAEGRAPDLALLDSVWVPEFAASGFLLPLDELDADWAREEYLRDALEPFRVTSQYGGHVIAAQAEADVVGLWYRRESLDTVGLAPPTTWDELRSAIRRLVSEGQPDPFVLTGGSRGGETTTYCLLGLLARSGASVVQEGQVTVNDAATVEVLTTLADFVTEGLLSKDVVSYDYDRAARLLAQGQAAILLGGSYELRTIADEVGLGTDEVWEHFGFVAPPAGRRPGATTLAGGMVYGVFRQAEHPQLAVTLLRRVWAPDSLAEMSRRTGQIAARRSAAELAAQDSEFLAVTGRMLEGAMVRPAIRTYPLVSAQLQAMLESVLVGQRPPAAAAERAAEMIAAVTGLPVRPA